MSVLSRRLREEEYLLAELQLWAVSSGASVWLIDLEPYERCRVAGVVRILRLDPLEGHIEAVITDGTGELVARWPISRPVPQLVAVPGRRLLLDGFAVVGKDAQLMLLEPAWKLVSLPEVA